MVYVGRGGVYGTCGYRRGLWYGTSIPGPPCQSYPGGCVGVPSTCSEDYKIAIGLRVRVPVQLIPGGNTGWCKTLLPPNGQMGLASFSQKTLLPMAPSVWKQRPSL